MHYVELVGILAVVQYLGFALLAGRARGLSGLKAPAMTGDIGFERMHRVQMNTLEVLVLFLPALYLAAKYWPASFVAIAGAIYIIGRIVYWRAYMVAPQSRTLGFALSIGPCLVLLVASLIGAIRSML